MFKSSGSDSDSDSDTDIDFVSVDFSGVDFDADPTTSADLSPDENLALAWERDFCFGDFSALDEDSTDSLKILRNLGKQLAGGEYVDILRGETAASFFDGMNVEESSSSSVARFVRQQVFANGISPIACIELECLGVAALNLFLQANYTGPSFDDDNTVADINPDPCFSSILGSSEEPKVESTLDGEKKESLTRTRCNTKHQNNVLSELAVDGEWPCQVCHAPYFLLLARSLLSTLSDPNNSEWTKSQANESLPPASFVHCASKLAGVHLWSARAIVAHERLLQAREPSATLWEQAESTFETCIRIFCLETESDKPDPRAATVMLEWGLAQHYFDRPGKGKKSFDKAQQYSGLFVEVTGAKGRRTKFQQKATAQMLVRATSAAKNDKMANDKHKDLVKGQMIEHSEDGILLERTKFEDEKENEVTELSVLDQAILLALCLDVKNSNPADGLTGEEMSAFLARVLDHHDDWMVYSTGLLERAWLEFERSHARERAILQMQALADQHTNRLTITQSTRESIEESAPVQDRLKNLHRIVYPPRWSMLQDLADRYANLGIVTSAAELYTEIEFWDDVVDCYRRAGRVSKAEQIVRERLATEETPRMWAALGDLTNDPEHYRRAVAVSKGRFSTAYIKLGHYYFDKGELQMAAEQYDKALKIRPLTPYIWFRLGTISMQLERWDTALRAFSEVVQQEPTEGDAWANVAAVHMHNKKPAEAYPALVESLKYNRNNWRVWTSKLYTCLDLEKYDESIQACNTILDLKAEHEASEGIPELEEKCIRAIVGGTLKRFHESRDDEVALDSARRTLSRVHGLLDRISSKSHPETWIFEIMAFFHEQVGHDEMVLDNLMKEYRSLQAIHAWEKDDNQVKKVCQVVSHIVQINLREAGRESLTKARFLVRGVIKKIHSSRPDDTTIPKEVERLETLKDEIERKLQNT